MQSDWLHCMESYRFLRMDERLHVSFTDIVSCARSLSNTRRRGQFHNPMNAVVWGIETARKLNLSFERHVSLYITYLSLNSSKKFIFNTFKKTVNNYCVFKKNGGTVYSAHFAEKLCALSSNRKHRKTTCLL